MNHVVSNIPGQTRMVDVLRRGFRTSNNIAISVSFLRYSGLGLVLDDLLAFTARGGKARILTSTYLGITQPEALNTLLNIKGVESRIHIAGYTNINLVNQNTGFHTKFYIFRNGVAECWVGSSNFTKGGLASNLEANLCHRDIAAIQSLEEVFEILWNSEDVITVCPKFTEEYATALRSKAIPPRQTTSPLFDSIHIENHSIIPITQEEKHIDYQHKVIKPNEAQSEALERLGLLRQSGEIKAAVIAAPGIGKTFLAAFDAQALNAKNILYLSHRLEHLLQAQRTFKNVFGKNRSYGQMYGGINEINADFVFATVQSASQNDSLLKRNFDYVVVDEFHHAEAPSYRRILQALTYDFLLGLTATPERQDGHDVLRLCDYNVAYEVRLVEAINRRWLLPFHYFGISDVTVDYSQIPWRSNRFDVNELENALMLERRVDEILRHALNRGYDGKKRATVGFCAGVRHAKFMADAFQRRGYCAVAITGEDAVEYRECVYKQFEDPNDSLEWLFVSDVLNEGVDIPCINSILFLRPTESSTIFIQQLGRGLRLSGDSDVLTVLDFVGHHRSAWLAIDALQDRDAGETSASIPELNFTPPSNCEVILDTQTLAILEKLQQQAQTKKQNCLDAYLKLRADLPRPYPLDLWGRNDCPEFSVFRSAFGSWIRVRQAANDSEKWEDELREDDFAYQFLLAIERDWQQQRVYSYALLWGLCVDENIPAEQVYSQFFERFPRWKVEFKPLPETKAWQTLRKKIGHLLNDDRLHPDIWSHIPKEQFLIEVEGRIRLTLERDYKLRHGGIIRRPDDLVLHRRYDRPEIINHFGVQYDPARHNVGIMVFDYNIVLIIKLDTSSAMQAHQYINRFIDSRTFAWQSQNQQRQDNDAGRLVLNHQQTGHSIHLFVQSRSHEKAYYCGTVTVQSVEGNAPMNVQFKLGHELSPSICSELLQ
ncbi:MAG: DUF3427 domain-containing protein [Acidobacteriota bacterium]